MKYITKKSEVVFHGRVFNVRVDEVQKTPEHTMRVDVVEHGGAVIILPIDEENRVWLVDQYRYPAKQRMLELPAGTLDPGEEPEACAIRECREEIGMSPGRLAHLGGFFLAPGYSTEFVQLYLAQDLSPAPLEQDEDEDIRVQRLTLDEIRDCLVNSEFNDSKTIASLFLAFQHLGVLNWK